ncbi:MAG: hypothetical protein COT84_08800 [Chlamydiae bacterium CG10_big_fil_rev_8_21_14_0_10_35_9]|nr:MAG: hypothetical protein COT84_08800 [Chlamydiae bacterium CG10_big_fil_rev_8_21_14_0_10_35_9]
MVSPAFVNSQRVSITPDDFKELDESFKRFVLKKYSELPNIDENLKREIIDRVNTIHQYMNHKRSKEFILYREAYKIYITVENFIYRANDKILDLWGDKRPIHERPLILQNVITAASIGVMIILGRHIYRDLRPR